MPTPATISPEPTTRPPAGSTASATTPQRNTTTNGYGAVGLALGDVRWDGMGRDETGWDGMGRVGTGWDVKLRSPGKAVYSGCVSAVQF